MNGVRVGQLWADNDWRSEGRMLRVDRVEVDARHLGHREPYAACTVIAAPRSPSAVGRTTYIKLRRFRPNSTGYRLLKDAP